MNTGLWWQPVLFRGLIAVWVLIAAWLGARMLADARTLTLPVEVAGTMRAPQVSEPWLAAHWRAGNAGEMPLTTLPIAWVGAIRAVPVDGSVVVLSYQKRQHTLTVGEPIGPRLTLVDIDQAGLVLDNGGRRERLPWPEARPLKGLLAADTAAQPASPSERPDFTALLRRIQATPLLGAGGITGYRLQPGAEPELFARLGFEPGDVLRRVEQVPVGDTAILLERMRQWREAGSVSLELERRGRLLTLNVELPL